MSDALQVNRTNGLAGALIQNKTGSSAAQKVAALLGLLEQSDIFIRSYTAQQRAESQRLLAQIAGLEAGVIRREADVIRLEADVVTLHATIRTRDEMASSELAHVRRVLAARDTQLSEFINSTSWRLTQPLRQTLTTMRGLLKFGRSKRS